MKMPIIEIIVALVVYSLVSYLPFAFVKDEKENSFPRLYRIYNSSKSGKIVVFVVLYLWPITLCLWTISRIIYGVPGFVRNMCRAIRILGSK